MIRQGIVSSLGRGIIDAQLDHDGHPKPHSLTERCTVQLEPQSGCGNCTSAGNCGIQMLPLAPAPVLLHAQIQCATPIHIGDRVNVRIAEPDSGWLQVVGMAYGLPTLCMIIGAIAGYGAAMGLQRPELAEIGSLLGFFIGLTGGLIAWDKAEKLTRSSCLGPDHINSATIVDVVANSGETR